jgi:predicted Zn-dependent peptidase
MGSSAAALAAPDRSAPPTLSAPVPFKVPAPTHFTLKNGIRVVLFERSRAPLIDLVVNVEGGIAVDPIDRPGLANATTAMLLEGAGEHDALAFADAQAALGAQLSTGVGLSSSTVVLHVASSRIDAGLALLSDVLWRPRFDPSDWQRVKMNLLSVMLSDSEDPNALAALAAARAAWGTQHRFGVSTTGTPRSVAGIQIDDIRAFHRRVYRPDAVTVIAVGAISKRALEAKLSATLGGWVDTTPRAARASMSAPPSIDKPRVVAVQIDGAAQTVVRWVAPTATTVQPYDAGVDVANTLLGGSFTSRLNDNLREQHSYAYGAGSRVLFTPAGNLLVVRTSVEANATVFALGEIEFEMARMVEPASDAEVQRARNLVALGFPAAFDNGRTLALTWSELLSQGVPAERVNGYAKTASAVSVVDLQRAGTQMVQPQRASWVLVGDVRAHASALSRFGSIEWVSAKALLPGVDELARQP